MVTVQGGMVGVITWITLHAVRHRYSLLHAQVRRSSSAASGGIDITCTRQQPWHIEGDLLGASAGRAGTAETGLEKSTPENCSLLDIS